ncbi:G patch domain-containing protein 1 -like protein [Toxocara canis]|uniref:G patch domain-containing protein 1-like protein n=1 Tax=Toxocara canis TaxID=6265 RepID=A0A0B2UPN3_TOXCA|nr:G patch domain-containing protein 1 -like protein [Toxocara canis]
MAEKRQGAPPFFDPPRLPNFFRPVHHPIPFDVSSLPEAIKKFGEKMTHVQRAKFLGEREENGVVTVTGDEDRKRLAARASSSAGPEKDFDENIFEDEPMKQTRFRQYVHYLKRGLSFPQPLEMTSVEWERELAEFQRVLPPYLRSLLPEVKARQMPLANADLAAPIAQILKSKFTPSSGGHSDRKKNVKDEDRLMAVRMKMFGEMTRQSHEWHPARQLSKRFNVPDPYPSSTLVGVPHLQKATRTETLLNLGSTAEELQYLTGRRKQAAAVEEATDTAVCLNLLVGFF